MINKNHVLEPKDFFRFFRNLQKTGVLEKQIRPERERYQYVPGRRYFEDIKEKMLAWDMKYIADKVICVSPVIKKLGDEKNWTVVELEPKDFFRAVRNLQRAGILDLLYENSGKDYAFVPGRRYFENIKEYLNQCDMRAVAEVVEKLSPVIKLLADERNLIFLSGN